MAEEMTIEKDCDTCAYQPDCDCHEQPGVRLNADTEVVCCDLWLERDPDGGPLKDHCDSCDWRHDYPSALHSPAYSICRKGEWPPERGYCPGWQAEGENAARKADEYHSWESGA